MKWTFRFALVTALLSSSLLIAQEIENPLAYKAKGPDVRVNNWVLAKPQGKVITVLDLAKRLEVAFHRAYPQYSNQPQAKYQFFKASWRHVLNDMIDSELMLADAEEKKVVITDPEIRKEMEEMFAPNVVQTIDKLGLTFEEAWDMVKTEIIVRKMRGYMVHSRAMTSISPDSVRKAYDKHNAEKGHETEWEFQILSIRHDNSDQAAAVATAAEKLLEDNPGITLDVLKERLKSQQAEGAINQEAVITVSARDSRAPRTLSDAHRKVLENLEPGDYSAPIAQESRDGSNVYRIFHFVTLNVKVPPPFEEMFPKLNEQLLEAAVEEQHSLYVARLRDHYGITDQYLSEMIPQNFQPFYLN